MTAGAVYPDGPTPIVNGILISTVRHRPIHSVVTHIVFAKTQQEIGTDFSGYGLAYFLELKKRCFFFFSGLLEDVSD